MNTKVKVTFFISVMLLFAVFSQCTTGSRDAPQPQPAIFNCFRTEHTNLLSINESLSEGKKSDTLFDFYTKERSQFSILNSIEPTGNAQLDSLLQLAAVAPQDTTLAFLYYQIGFKYTNIDVEQAKKYLEQSKYLSEQLDWTKGRIAYATGMAQALYREQLTDSTMAILKEAHDLAVREQNKSLTAYVLFHLANANFAINWYQTAMDYYMESMSIYEQLNDTDKLQAVYYMMSQTYSNLDDMEKAVEYGKKSVSLDPEDPSALIALGTAYFNAHQHETGKGYLEEALRICETQNNLYLKGVIIADLADCAMAVFDLDLAEKYALQSLEIRRPFGRATFCNNYIQLGNIELMRGHYAQSEAYIREALQIATDLGKLENKKNCYKHLYELAIAQHRYREGIQYQIQFDLIVQELARETTLRASEEMNAKYETGKKQFEIERQQNVIARQNLHRWLLAGGVTVCVVFLALLWYMLRMRSRHNLALSDRNAALSEMNATKDKFFSIISHDMRNPVVAQRDALRLLVQNSRLWDVDTLIDYYHELLNSADGQVELIYNLLGWAQLQTGRITYTPATFNLAHRLRSDIALIRNMAEKKGVSFVVSIPDDADITGDAAMLSVVIRNLLTNAVKFTTVAGTVTLEVTPAYGNPRTLPLHHCGDRSDEAIRDDDTQRIALDCRPRNDATVSSSLSDSRMPSPHIAVYTVTVSDTGVGLSAEQISKLFRLDSARSRKGTAGEQGSGLGLIVCRELIEKHGSELHVESEEGKGSRFWFEV